MAVQFKIARQRQSTVIERICPKGFLLCLLIKDEMFGDREQ